MKIIIAITLVILFTGCSRLMEGEVFIVKPDRTTIKLSLVDVIIVPRDEFIAYKEKGESQIASQKTKAQALLRENSEKSTEVKNKLYSLKTDRQVIDMDLEPLQSKILEVTNNIDFLTRDTSITPDTRTRWIADAKKQLESLRKEEADLLKLRDPKNNEIQKLEVTRDQLEKRRKELIEDYEKAKLAFLQGFKKIPSAVVVTTNADGKFSRKMSDSAFSLYADVDLNLFTSPDEVGGGTKTFRWIVGDVDGYVMLNNVNLLPNEEPID